MPSRLLHKLLLLTIGGAVLAPLIAFQYSFMGLVFIKTMGFFVLVELALVLYLILLYRRQVALPHSNPVNWLLGVFLLAMTISTIVSAQPYTSFWGSYSRMFGLLTWLHLGAFFYIIISVLNNRTVWSQFLYLIIWSSVPIALYGIGQYLSITFLTPSETSRVDSTIGNPIFLAGYLLAVIPITWAHLLSSRHRLWRWLLVATGALQIVCLILTGSRSGLIALLVAVALMLMIYGVIYHRRVLLIILGALTSLVIIGFSSIQFNRDTEFIQNQTFLRRISEIRLDNDNNLPRLIAWRQGIVAWSERPVFGWGPENFDVAFNQHYRPGIERYTISETWLDRAHNSFVDLLVMTGLLGLLSYIAFLISVSVLAWRRFRRSQEDKHISLAVFITVMAYSAFVFFAFDTLASVVILLVLVAWVAAHPQSSAYRWEIHPIFIWSIALATIVAVYPFTIRNIVANRVMGYAIQDFYKQDFLRAEDGMRRALQINSFINSGISNQLMEMGVDAFNHANQNQLRLAVEPALATTLELAETTFRRIEPMNAFLYSKLLWSYSHLVSWDGRYLPKAEEIFDELKQLSPNRPDSYVTMANIYSIAGQYTQADNFYTQAKVIYPEWGYISYAQGINQLLQDNVNQAEVYFRQATELGYQVVSDDPRLSDVALRNTLRITNILEVNGRLDLAEQYLLKLVAKTPRQADSHVALARFYYRQNRLADAHKALIAAYQIDHRHNVVQQLLTELYRNDPGQFPLPSS